ncbi:MAG: NAD-dependent deacylase [Chloroflexota bacterium]|nr:NAD-dependent deacylase [Chloroflexota bacterium]
MPEAPLTTPIPMFATPGDLDRVADLIRMSERMSVFTGAGISTESGIPDYRGPDGVWARQAIPHIDTIRTDAEARAEHWQDRRRRYPEMFARVPNAGHEAIAEFEATGRLLTVITQNIDGLHQKAGNSADRVIELHGSTHVIRCTQCGQTYSGTEIQQRLDQDELDPRCPVCGGVLRTGTVLFGESLPERALRTAHAVAQATDLMVVVGSSLVVNPAARLPVIAKDSGARLVIINQSGTPIDDLADVRIQAGAGDTLSAIVARVRSGDQ